jgi:hypothetical protein
MSERIKELIKQVGTDVSGKWMNVDDSEKFAELIVKECVEVADHSNVNGTSIIGERIKQHFGFETWEKLGE